MFFPNLAEGDQFGLSNTEKKDNLNNPNNSNIGKSLNILIFYYQFCAYRFFKGLKDVYSILSNYCINYLEVEHIDEIAGTIEEVKTKICTIISRLLKEEDKDTSKSKHKNIIFAIKAIVTQPSLLEQIKKGSDQDTIKEGVDPKELLEFLHMRQKDEEGSDMYFMLEEEEYYNFHVIDLIIYKIYYLYLLV